MRSARSGRRSIIALALIIGGCGSSSESIPAKVRGLTNGTSVPEPSGTNYMKVTVNGDQCLPSAISYLPNAACVSVTICGPSALSSSDSTCQVIPGLLLDTGSVGLRLFRSVLNSNLLSGLTPVLDGGRIVSECVTYGDYTADWGPLAHATVFMGGESGVQTPIQLIDKNYGGQVNGTYVGQTICNSFGTNVTLDTGPSQLLYNGILGVGMYGQDCGSSCTLSNLAQNPGFYYSCSAGSLSSSSSCSTTEIALATGSQLQNPVSLLPVNKNGIAVELPSVGDSGAVSATGYVIFGVGTQSNNTPDGSVTQLPVNPSSIEIRATLNGTNNDAFIDSGTTFYDFPPEGTSGSLSNCSNWDTGFSGFYCPNGNSSSSVDLTFTLKGYQGSPTINVMANIGNPISIYSGVSSSAGVYSNFATGADSTPLNGASLNTVDFGLPFYLGRTIYHTYESATANPYWGI